jgi:hypothetical protein
VVVVGAVEAHGGGVHAVHPFMDVLEMRAVPAGGTVDAWKERPPRQEDANPLREEKRLVWPAPAVDASVCRVVENIQAACLSAMRRAVVDL